MRLSSLALKNVMRNRTRTIWTIVGVAIAVLTFVVLRTVLVAWTVAAEQSAKDRIGTRHKITFIMPLPKRYVQDIDDVDGVSEVTWMNWFGGVHPTRTKEFFANIAVDPDTFLKVYDEIVLDPAVAEAWKQNRRGAIIGDVLAKKFGWKAGDRITLTGTIFPGNWEFDIAGLYTVKRRTVDRSTLWFHWDYLNESLPPGRRDMVGWITARIDEPGRSAAISKAIDAKFAERDNQTVTMSERAMNLSFLGMFSAILFAVNLVSIVILGIMALILANTIAMGVRERTHEYGVLRAIGFLPKHIFGFVVGEGIAIGILGGGLGILLAAGFIESMLGPFLEENMGAYFPYFRIAPRTMIEAMVLSAILGVLASGVPARLASRLDVVHSLRRLD